MRLHKQLMLAVATLVTSSFLLSAMGESVYSVNVVGFQKKELAPANQFTLTSAPFIQGEANTLLGIFGMNTLKQDNNYVNCDRVLVYDIDEQAYQAWAQWTDGTFYKANTAAEWNQGVAGNPEIPAGTGFWIVSASDASPSRTITFAGDVVMAESVPVPVVEGFQILSYPFSSAIELQGTSFFADGATANNSFTSADRVHVFLGDSYQAFALWTDGQWYKANTATEWNQSILATNVFAPGDAFFYEARAGIIWSETNKYLNALGE